MSRVRIYSRFEELPAESSRIFSAAAAQDFFFELPWFLNLAENSLNPDELLRLYHAEAGTLEQSGAIFAAHFLARGEGLLRMRKLHSLANFYSSLFGVLGKEDACVRTANDIARVIATEKPAWDALEIKPLDPQSPAYAALVNALESAGFVVQTYFCFVNWYLKVNERSFVEYFQSLPPALRNTLSRKRKKLEKSGRARIEIITGGPALDAAIAAYEKVYLASWKKREPFAKFVPGLIRLCAERGWLRLGLIHVDDVPAAAQLWIVHNGIARIFKLAYDERFADLSAGTILTARLMEYVIDADKVHTVDYLTGDDAYKKDWMSHRRERWGILALNPRTVKGTLGIILHVGGRAVKTTVRGLIQRSRMVLPNPLPAWQRFSKRSSGKGSRGREERKTSEPSAFESFSGIERPSDRG